MRNVAVIVFALAFAVLGAETAVGDDNSDYEGAVSYFNDEVDVDVFGAQILPGERVGEGRGPSGERTCRNGSQEVKCSSDFGVWHNHRACYVSLREAVAPELEFQGNLGGYVMQCTMLDESSYPFWQSTPEPVPPPPDPALLARRAVDAMRLAPVEMGMFPKSLDEDRDALGYVGWNQWLWARSLAANTWGPITASASLDGYTVRATATVDRVEWDMGNGDVVTCGAGTPWQERFVNNEPSPDCGYVYDHPGRHTVTATSHWDVEWEGIGRTGAFAMQLSDSQEIEVAEIQVVITGYG